MKVIKI